jgi:AcrR family transcriptional regulator
VQPTPSARRPRSDGLANRKRILHAASAAFAARGLDVPMDHVAREAKVGPATLYRHFPNRDALVEALLLDLHEDLHAQIDAEREAGKSAWEVFEAMLRIAARLALDNHAFTQSLQANPYGGAVLDRLTFKLFSDLGKEVALAQRAGDMREDFAEGDLLLLLRCISVSGAVEDPAAVQLLIERQLTFMLDALRAPGRTPAPGPRLSVEDAAEMLRVSS